MSNNRNLTSDIAKDIYAALTPLTKGKHLDISDEDIENFGESMKAALTSWARPPKRDSSFSLRMSNIGKPIRRLWFDKHGDVTQEGHSPQTFIKFLYGHLLEEVVLMLARLTDNDVSSEQKEVVVDSVSGHMDCKINGEVVDVKTASGYAFRKFKDGSLREDDPFGYIPQLAGYEEAEGTEKGGFLVINKESGELCFFAPDDLDKPIVRDRISKITKALDKKKPPSDLCYEPVDEGKKGNKKLHKNCTFCPHKFECFKDSNDGEGLRTFKYNRGYMYLTKVASTPRVEEIL